MNSEKSKTSKSHVLILKLADKYDFRSDEKSTGLSNLSIYYKWKKLKNVKLTNLKYHLQHGILNFN